MRRTTLATLAGLTIICAAADAHAQSNDDPLEKTNRTAFDINLVIDKVLIAPLTAIYKALTPGPIGRGIHNMVINLSEPETTINNLLQGRLRRANIATIRFLVNSTIGIGGLFDVVAHVDPTAAHEDNNFGVTLGVWGFKPGPYLFLPLLGPTTVRDLFGVGVDAVANPFVWVNYPGRTELTVSSTIVGGLDLSARTAPELETLLSQAADPYATLRSVYLQNRQGQVQGTEVTPINDLPNFDDTDSTAPSAAPQLSTPAPAAPETSTPAPAPGPQPFVAASADSEVIRSAGGRYADDLWAARLAAGQASNARL